MNRRIRVVNTRRHVLQLKPRVCGSGLACLSIIHITPAEQRLSRHARQVSQSVLASIVPRYYLGSRSLRDSMRDAPAHLRSVRGRWKNLRLIAVSRIRQLRLDPRSRRVEQGYYPRVFSWEFEVLVDFIMVVHELGPIPKIKMSVRFWSCRHHVRSS